MMKYAKYKESGVEWIGDIPLDWLKVRLKLISSISKGKKPKKEYEDYTSDLTPYLSMDYLRGKNSQLSYASTNEKGLIKVNEGDLLILWDGSKAGEIVKAKKGVLSSTMALINIIDNSFDDVYLNYLLQLGQKYIQANTIGMGIPHVNGSVLRNLIMLIPSLTEQTQIAKYLDHKTGLIDALVEKKELLITKLKKQRQALINEAVTKGLNPNAKMKDSGVEWLGEIPLTHELVPLRYICKKVGSGITPKGGSQIYSDKGVIFIRSQNVYNDGLRLNDVARISNDIHNSMNGSKVHFDDVLLNITGASIGRSTRVDEDIEMNVNQHVCVLRPNNKIKSEFLALVLQSEVGQVQIRLGITGGNREGLNFEAIKKFMIPLPIIEDQINIIKKTKKEISNNVETCSLILNQIEQLKTYRQSIISESVTGKVDVRDWNMNTISE